MYHTCMSTNVIYLLKCPCGSAYVGKTNRMVRVRLNEHRSAIRNVKAKPTSVSRHWAEYNHTISQLRWMVLEEVVLKSGNVDQKPLQRETYWIWKLNTLAPRGLNEAINYTCFL
ncbi:hypothetical protein XELAEV_18019279mg [Xenopus laevis]|uniref:GIY-YIG domain-containing protein n=1 Tax=Xenopus laevis TaxID=8355 RepID=A0A974HU88_XENLA|nr:hypothetical protein XELAEV_18019279mg [Xenopus laevis]